MGTLRQAETMIMQLTALIKLPAKIRVEPDRVSAENARCFSKVNMVNKTATVTTGAFPLLASWECCWVVFSYYYVSDHTA